MRLLWVLRRYPIGGFLALTFAISWGVPATVLLAAPANGEALAPYSPLSYIAVWGPALASLVIVAAQGGRGGLAGFARRLVRAHGPARWYLLVLLGIPALNLAAAALAEALGRDALQWPETGLGAMLAAAALRLTEGPVEEIGWRGFLLPHLQRRMSGLAAAVWIGAIWWLWHLPAVVVGRSLGGGVATVDLGVLAMFLATLVAQSVLIALVYNATRGSLLVAVLFHWMTNFPYPWETGADLAAVAGPLWIVAAVALALVFGRRHLGRREQASAVMR